MNQSALINVVIGAVIAALISFGGSALAVLTAPAVHSIHDIPSITWVVMAVTTAVSFLKDFQAIWTRDVVDKVTKANSKLEGGFVRFRVLVAIAAIAGVVACSGLGGPPAPTNVSESIGQGYATVTTASHDIQYAVQTGVITPDQGNAMLGEVSRGLLLLDTARTAYAGVCTTQGCSVPPDLPRAQQLALQADMILTAVIQGLQATQVKH